MVNGSGKSPGCGSSLGSQICSQRRKSFIVARIIGEFDRDGFGVALRDGSIQFLYCSLGFVTLIKANKANAFG